MRTNMDTIIHFFHPFDTFCIYDMFFFDRNIVKLSNLLKFFVNPSKARADKELGKMRNTSNILL